MKRIWFLTMSLVFILVACGQKAPSAPTPFDYNPKVPYDTKIISQSEKNGMTVTQLSYAAHDPSWAPFMGGQTVVTLVSPKGKGPYAGVMIMFGHNGWGPQVTWADSQISEAAALASHGAVVMIFKDYFPGAEQAIGGEADRAKIIGQVIEIRRGFDFLLTQPGVDPKRLGFLGDDTNGIYGGVLAGVEKRIKTFVLVAAWPTFDQIISYGVPNVEDRADVKDIEPVNYVSQAAPASLYFQFAKNDDSVNESLANQYYDAASQPKMIEWFDDVHGMRSEAVLKAQRDWLIEQLKLEP